MSNFCPILVYTKTALTDMSKPSNLELNAFGASGGAQKLCSVWKNIEDIGGILYLVKSRLGKPCKRLITPMSCRKDILHFIGHPGTTRMMEVVTRNFYWPGISSYVRNGVSNCHPCDIIKGSNWE